MENILKRQVLEQFKKLHQARKFVFKDDDLALSEARKLINEGFKKNKNMKLKSEIQKEIQLAIDVTKELENNVIQAVEAKPGVYEANVRDEILLDNHMFNVEAVHNKSALKKGCCGGADPNIKPENKDVKNK